MDLYIYSDESGVFDKVHNEIFVFGGMIFLGKDSKNEWSRRYIVAENTIRSNGQYKKDEELKATSIRNKEKGKLYRSLNKAIKFGVIINEKRVLDRIFQSKKDKQRYLDYAYKIGLKKALEKLIEIGAFSSGEIERIHIYCDEHTTATNGRYELREGLEQEFKNGTYNFNYDKFFPPIFPSLKELNLYFCNSRTTTLVRAADIVANRIYHAALERKFEQLDKIHFITLP